MTVYADRAQAGKMLAKKLRPFSKLNPVILALPRGGVVTAHEIARALRAPLDCIIVRKIGHPYSPEYAVGAVDEHGATIFNESEATAIDMNWLQTETELQLREAKRRAQKYRGERSLIDLEKRVVIIVDDGIATGITARLAIKNAQGRKARRIIVASPVAPSEATELLHAAGATVVVLDNPHDFLGSIGAHYVDFPQVDDTTVVSLLALHNTRP